MKQLHFFLSFPVFKPSEPTPQLSSKFMASFITNCCCIYICIYFYISKYSLFSQYNVTCTYVLKDGHLALDNQLGCLFWERLNELWFSITLNALFICKRISQRFLGYIVCLERARDSNHSRKVGLSL